LRLRRRRRVRELVFFRDRFFRDWFSIRFFRGGFFRRFFRFTIRFKMIGF